MKKLIAFAGIALLAACSQAETEAPAVEETVAAPVVGSVTPGTYNVAWEDGTTSVFTLNDDGSYAATRNGENEEGTSAIVDGKICFTPAAEGAETNCWTNSEVGADGSFTSVSDDGETVTLTVAESAAAPIAAPAAE